MAFMALLVVSTTADRPRMALMRESTATACFWVKPMSMSRWWMCPRSGAMGLCPRASRRRMAKQVSKMGRPSTRKGTAKEMMA